MTSAQTPQLGLACVSLAFGRERVLHEVSLSVHAGEIVTLIGPNGAGKTSLVRVALGLLVPDAGQVQRRVDLRIGYVPQRLQVDDSLPLTVRRFLGLGRRAPPEQARAALADVGASYLLEAPVQRLSGGELRRVILARALLQQPDLLVLDEPTAGIDVAGQADFYALIERLRSDRGCAVLLVSHDLHLVMAATDRVVCLNHHVCCQGTPEDVRVHPEYLTLFQGELSGQLAVYTHRHDHDHDLHGDVARPRDGSHG
jgi:zinc transport system ATP-binding protein